jgi:hypothetical protein
MSDKLIAIYCSEDGDKSIQFTTKAEFLKQMERDLEDGCSPSKFAKPGEKLDLDHFVGYILIAGEVIVPKAVEKVTKYEL